LKIDTSSQVIQGRQIERIGKKTPTAKALKVIKETMSDHSAAK